MLTFTPEHGLNITGFVVGLQGYVICSEVDCMNPALCFNRSFVNLHLTFLTLSFFYGNRGLGKGDLTDVVYQRLPHSFKTDLDPVACSKVESIREREFHRPEEVEVYIPGNTELRILEMVIL